MLSGESASLFFRTEEEVFSASEAYKFTVPVFGRGVVYDAPFNIFQEQRK
jgi:spermidine synthase